MTDGIQKGTGNAYSLQTVANILTLYPTYEEFAQAFATGQLFTDLKLNPEGWDPLGTSLNKANLLSDETAAMYGKPATAVPDDILAAIKPLITAAQNTANKKAKIEVVRYTGTGTYGEENPTTVKFSFTPLLIWLVGDLTFRFPERVPTEYIKNGFFSESNNSAGTRYNGYGKRSEDGKTYSMYAEYVGGGYEGSTAYGQRNAIGAIYAYIAIG